MYKRMILFAMGFLAALMLLGCAHKNQVEGDRFAKPVYLNIDKSVVGIEVSSVVGVCASGRIVEDSQGNVLECEFDIKYPDASVTLRLDVKYAELLMESGGSVLREDDKLFLETEKWFKNYCMERRQNAAIDDEMVSRVQWQKILDALEEVERIRKSKPDV